MPVDNTGSTGEPGYTFDAKSVQRISKAVQRSEATDIGFTKRSQPAAAPNTIIGKITSGTNPYAWTQQRLTGSGTENMPNAITGTTSKNEAYEIRSNTTVTAGQIVELTQSVIMDGDNARTVWMFRYYPPLTGLYQGQVEQMGTDLVRIFDYPNLHSI